MYPDNVAYPFGGEGYIMIELHYDNPLEIEGKTYNGSYRFNIKQDSLFRYPRQFWDEIVVH